VSFRARLTLGVAAAVAVTVVAASMIVFVVVRSQLRGEVDDALRQRAAQVNWVGISQLSNGQFFLDPRGGNFGGARGFIQVATASGKAILPPGATAAIPITQVVKDVALQRRKDTFIDAHAEGTHLRVLVRPTDTPGYAVMVARPLTEVDASLGRIETYLIGIGAGGILIAVLLGLLVTRAVLRPVRRLTEASEHVAETRDLSERMDASGRDELARLAASFNTMLEALEDSLRAQRQLVADASHELRTPLTSLRTNIEVLARAHALPPEERETLLADVVEQLTEMSTLVSELVQLARGDQPAGEPETVRLDELVLESVERARRNSPRVTFATELYESTVEAVPAALERAVGNLLDNAAKWSPPGGTVEVAVVDHEVAVRDHGPGIDETDLPFVFDRFYRALSSRSAPGSGLGLAVVREIVAGHGGTIAAEAAPRGGTIMRLTLPLMGTAPVTAAEQDHDS
jgi:two-component system, OmpR family, sensor histidine kinase MprB